MLFELFYFGLNEQEHSTEGSKKNLSTFKIELLTLNCRNKMII